MPWIVSPFNGNIIEVNDGSPLLKTATVVSGPSKSPVINVITPPSGQSVDQYISSGGYGASTGQSSFQTAKLADGRTIDTTNMTAQQVYAAQLMAEVSAGVRSSENALSVLAGMGLDRYGNKTYVTTPGTSSGSTSTGGGTTTMSAASAEAKRREEVSKLTLSTVPEIANIQRLAQEEYIRTGVWNKKYNDQAEAIRKGMNPMYPGGGNGSNEGQYILPGAGGEQPNVDGVGGLFSGVLNFLGSGANTAGGAANAAASSGSSGFMWAIIGVVAIFILGRR